MDENTQQIKRGFLNIKKELQEDMRVYVWRYFSERARTTGIHIKREDIVVGVEDGEIRVEMDTFFNPVSMESKLFLDIVQNVILPKYVNLDYTNDNLDLVKTEVLETANIIVEWSIRRKKKTEKEFEEGSG